MYLVFDQLIKKNLTVSCLHCWTGRIAKCAIHHVPALSRHAAKLTGTHGFTNIHSMTAWHDDFVEIPQRLLNLCQLPNRQH